MEEIHKKTLRSLRESQSKICDNYERLIKDLKLQLISKKNTFSPNKASIKNNLNENIDIRKSNVLPHMSSSILAGPSGLFSGTKDEINQPLHINNEYIQNCQETAELNIDSEIKVDKLNSDNIYHYSNIDNDSKEYLISTYKSLPQAHIKIFELEKDIEKIRSYYQSKIEGLNKKFDIQIRSLKRNPQDSHSPNHSQFQHQSHASSNSQLPIPPIPPQQYSIPSQSFHQLHVNSSNSFALDESIILKSYRERMTMLEDELKHATSEINKLKQAQSSENIKNVDNLLPITTPIINKVISNNQDDKECFIGEIKQLIQAELVIQQNKFNELHEKLIQENQSIKEQLNQKLNSLNKSIADKSHSNDCCPNSTFEVALWIQEKKCLNSEIDSLRSQVQAAKSELNYIKSHKNNFPKTPEIQQFEMLTSQIELLENRFKEREKGWKFELSQYKSRLRSSEAELREKNIALEDLQGELHSLIREMNRLSILNKENIKNFQPENSIIQKEEIDNNKFELENINKLLSIDYKDDTPITLALLKEVQNVPHQSSQSSSKLKYTKQK